MKRKFDSQTIEMEIQHFLQSIPSAYDSVDYLLSQLVHVVAELPKRKQQDFLNGLINAKQEMARK